MGSVFKPVKKAFGAGLPLIGIDNPFAETEVDLDDSALKEAEDALKKKKASTFTSGGLVGEELQSGTGTTFGN